MKNICTGIMVEYKAVIGGDLPDVFNGMLKPVVHLSLRSEIEEKIWSHFGNMCVIQIVVNITNALKI